MSYWTLGHTAIAFVISVVGFFTTLIAAPVFGTMFLLVGGVPSTLALIYGAAVPVVPGNLFLVYALRKGRERGGFLFWVACNGGYVIGSAIALLMLRI